MFKYKSSKAQRGAKQPVIKQNYFNNCHRIYSCIHCRAHLANHDELISKLFQGNHGRAYLFNKVVNIGCRPAVQRELLTGLHAVADIYCDNCETTLGWKYEQAFVPSQKYKEGKYIIELAHMLKENVWDLTSYNAREILAEVYPKRPSSQHKKSSMVENSVDYQSKRSRHHATLKRSDEIDQIDELACDIKENLEPRSDEREALNSDSSPIEKQNPPIPTVDNSDERNLHRDNETIVAQLESGIISDDVELVELSASKLQLAKRDPARAQPNASLLSESVVSPGSACLDSYDRTELKSSTSRPLECSNERAQSSFESNHLPPNLITEGIEKNQETRSKYLTNNNQDKLNIMLESKVIERLSTNISQIT